MSLSADSCLKRIRRCVEAAGYKEVSDARVREACLTNNFDPTKAATQLIKEEQLKIYLEDMCVRLGYQPNKQFIYTSCIKYKFKQLFSLLFNLLIVVFLFFFIANLLTLRCY